MLRALATTTRRASMLITHPCDLEQFKELIGLHKFYFEVLMSSVSFYLGVVGATVAYVAKDMGTLSPQRIRVALSIPIILSIAACAGYGRGYFELRDLADWVTTCKDDLAYAWAPHSNVLPPLSLLFSLMAGSVGAGLIAITARPRRFLDGPVVTASQSQ